MDWQLVCTLAIVAAAVAWGVAGIVCHLRRRSRGGCSCGCSGCELSRSCTKKPHDQ